MNRESLKQIAQFVGIGVINTGVDIVLFNILIWIFGVPTTVVYIVFRSISFFLANINSYFLNARFTFTAQKSIVGFGAFLGATIVGFLVNTTIATTVFALLKNSNLHQIITANLGIVLGTIVSMIVNFLLYKYVVFRKKNTAAD
jgi:putative flippase GtrA